MIPEIIICRIGAAIMSLLGAFMTAGFVYSCGQHPAMIIHVLFCGAGTVSMAHYAIKGRS